LFGFLACILWTVGGRLYSKPLQKHPKSLAYNFFSHPTAEPFEMIFPFLFIEVKGYNRLLEDGSQQPHKDGKPQAYQAMMSGLVLYDYTCKLASTRSPNQYQLWENETSIDDREMLKRSYGVVAHQSGWYFFVMVLCTNANAGAVGGRQFVSFVSRV
jgi:hypothetical protein